MRNRKKLVYYYDTETCNYEPVEKDLSYFLRLGSSAGVVVVMAAIGALLGYYLFLAPRMETQLSLREQALISQIEQVNLQLDQLDESLVDLHGRDNSFYRPLLQTGRIPSSYYQLGRGGTERYSRNNSNIVQATDVRIEQFLHRISIQRESYAELIVLGDEKSREMRYIPCMLPTNGAMISGFGYRIHPISGVSTLHTGVDFACEIGTPVYAAADGKIQTAEANGHGYGICVNVDHQNGFVTKYAHLSKVTVKQGEEVKRGQLIAYSGNTGRSTGPHLHYELIHNGEKVDPADYIYVDLLPKEYHALKSQSTIPMD